MKKSIVILLILGAAQTIRAQILSPVKWSYAAKKMSKGEAVLFIKANIDQGWHIYSVHEPEGGPVKTSFIFRPAKDYALTGKVSEPAPVSKYEDVFDITTKYFEGQVIFQQKIKLRAAHTIIKGTLKYMVCNAHQCLPPAEVNFEIPVN